MDGDRLFLALLASVRPLTALALSRALGVPNKSEINGALYAMERAGRVKRNVFPGSGPPLWEPVRPPTCVANVERPADTLVEAKTHEPDVVVVGDPSKPPFSLQELRSQALKALLLHPDGLAPSAVAKALHVSKKEANAALYALEVLGFATRESVCPPLWKVREGLHLSQACSKISDEGRSPGMGMAPSPTANELSCQPTAPKQKACEKALPIPAAGGNAGISLKQHCLQAKSNPVSLPVAVGLPDQALPAEGSPVSRKRRRGAEPPAVSEVFPGGDYPAISPLWGAEVAEAVWRRFHEAYSGSAQKHVVAGMVLVERNGCTAPSPRVVAIGSGNKSLKGDQLSLEGQKVQDCHAEVVARRSLLRWLYAQVEAAMRPMPGGSSSPTSVGSAVVPSPPGSAWPYRLRPGTELWLYISCAPCGDAAIFSRADQEGQANRGDGANAAEGLGLHFAMWPGTKNVGLLRSKVEAGAGSIPVKDGEEVEPGIDGVNRGQRVRRHSCSDKIAKWAVVGLQGSLLSRLLEPVYLRGVVVGDLFSAPHLHRALCCRSQRALLGSTLPAPFCLHHLQAVRGQPCDTRRHEAVMTCKRATADSVNWAEGDPKEGELLDATTGAVKTDPSKGRPGAPSRISKAALFASYCRLAPGASALTYSENKLKAEAYHCAKSKWTEAMKGAGFGCWLRRPSDADDFRL